MKWTRQCCQLALRALATAAFWASETTSFDAPQAAAGKLAHELGPEGQRIDGGLELGGRRTAIMFSLIVSANPISAKPWIMGNPSLSQNPNPEFRVTS